MSSPSHNKVQTFEIEFSREQAVYREGDNVTGKVKVDLKEDLKIQCKYITMSVVMSMSNQTLILHKNVNLI